MTIIADINSIQETTRAVQTVSSSWRFAEDPFLHFGSEHAMGSEAQHQLTEAQRVRFVTCFLLLTWTSVDKGGTLCCPA